MPIMQPLAVQIPIKQKKQTTFSHYSCEITMYGTRKLEKAITSETIEYINNTNKFQITADVKLNKKCCFLNYVNSNKQHLKKQTKKTLRWRDRKIKTY